MKGIHTGTKRILVVEDKPTISTIFQKVFPVEGFKVDTAANGEVALDMIEEKQYALCLIDIAKPATNGKELYMWLEEKYPELASQVIFINGDVTVEEVKGKIT
ncbi:response regulator [Chloroflexota bacterium]